MRLIGITGGIGTGKSVVARILRLKGYNVYDCDSKAKWLMENDSSLRRALKGIAGEEIYMNDGTLDRPKLASLIFGNSELRMNVNKSVHSAVRKDIERWQSLFPDGLLFVESAILVTSGLIEMTKEVWEVTASMELRLVRIRRRSGLSTEEALARIDSQKEEWKDLENRVHRQSLIIRKITNDADSNILARINDLIAVP